MRRWVIFILLLVVLGCLTTVLVAWISAGTSEIRCRGMEITSWTEERNETGPRLTTTGWSRWSYDYGVASSLTHVTPGESSAPFVELDPPPLETGELPSWDDSRQRCEGNERVHQFTHGWPMRSMLAVERWREIGQDESGPSVAIKTPWRLEQGLRIVNVSLILFEPQTHPTRDRVCVSLGPLVIVEGLDTQLPLRPVASGFTIDSVLFAGAWGVLLLFPTTMRSLRRWRRLRTARCAWCGHQIAPGAGSECPECGRSSPEPTSQPSRRVFAFTLAAMLVLLLSNASIAALLRLHFRSFESEFDSAVLRGGVDEVIQELDKVRRDSIGKESDCDSCAEVTALATAAWLGRLEVVRAMIARGVDPAGLFTSSSSPRPIEDAIRGGDRATIDELLRTLQARARTGDTANGAAVALCGALRVAVEESDAETIGLILADSPAARGEEWWCFPDTSGSLLFHAARSPDPRVLETLLAWYRRCSDSKGRIQGKSFATIVERSRAVPEAVRWRRHAQLAMLLETGAEIEPERPASATVAAVLSGDPAMLRRVLDAGAAPDADGAPTITIAMAFRQPEMIRMLVAAGADPNRDHPALGPPLCAAAYLEMPGEYRRLLIELGADDRGCPGRGLRNVE